MEQVYVTIAEFSTVFEAELAQAFLAENGIESFIKNEIIGSILPSTSFDNFVPIELQVVDSEHDNALNLLEGITDSYFTQKMLEESGALLNGHFVLTSGLHSDRYVEKIKIIQDPDKVSQLCQKLAERFHDLQADIVIGPAYGGIALAFELARQLHLQFAFTQRQDEKMSLRSGFQIKPGQRAIIVEDILTTGGSVKEVLNLMNEKEIKVVGIGVIVDRSGGTIDLGVRTEALLTLDIETYAPEVCPLCMQGMVISKPGSSDKK